MRRVQEFSVLPEPLSRQVGQFERNASDAIDDLTKTADTRPHKVYARKAGHICRAGDLVVCDGGQSIEILLTRPTADHDGLRLIVLKTKPGGTLTARGIDNCLVNGLASVSVSAMGVYTFFAADGEWVI